MILDRRLFRRSIFLALARIVVQLCQLAQVRHLCLFHHEPALDDGALVKMLEETRRYEEITRTGNAVRVSAAYDGLEITL